MTGCGQGALERSRAARTGSSLYGRGVRGDASTPCISGRACRRGPPVASETSLELQLNSQSAADPTRRLPACPVAPPQRASMFPQGSPRWAGQQGAVDLYQPFFWRGGRGEPLFCKL